MSSCTGTVVARLTQHRCNGVSIVAAAALRAGKVGRTESALVWISDACYLALRARWAREFLAILGADGTKVAILTWWSGILVG